MVTQNDLISEIEDEIFQKSKPIAYPIIACLYLLNIILFFFIFSLLLFEKVSFVRIISSPSLIFVILFRQVLPLCSFFLFIYRKRIGWILVIYFSLMDLILTIFWFIKNITLHFSDMPLSTILLQRELATLFILTVILILAFKKSIFISFKINNSIAFYTIAISIISSLLFRACS